MRHNLAVYLAFRMDAGLPQPTGFFLQENDRVQTMQPTYHGSCHCGAVRFEVTGDIADIATCDCSLCRKKNALMGKVPEAQLRLLNDWSALAIYVWNTGIARHYFCKTCGIYTFHRKRAQPDWFSFNIHCLDDFDPGGMPVRSASGRNMTVADHGARPEWPGPRVAPLGRRRGNG